MSNTQRRRTNRSKKQPITIIEHSMVPEVVNHILSPEAQKLSEFISYINKLAKDQFGIKIPIMIDSVQDNHDPSITYPINQDVNIPSTYFMQFSQTRHILHHNTAKLSSIDFYVLHYLCDHFSESKEFFISHSFWNEIQSDMDMLQLTYSAKSIHNSISKLTKLNILLKMAKSCYSINKLLIFAGPLSLRPQSIKDQFVTKKLNS